ncbi:MAG: transcription-repair coupling factor [Clostridia bacterium]|nr:transcription-repair coupling factor [Clostridia bacterium]
MSVFLDIMEELAEFSELCGALKSNITPVSVTGVSDSVMAHLVFCVCKKLNRGGLIVARSETAAAELYRDLSFFAGEDAVVRFNESELMLHDAEAKSRDVSALRLAALGRLSEAAEGLLVITSPEALLSATFPRERWENSHIHLEVGDEIELSQLAERLTDMGYTREEVTEGVGQFSIRGGIADIFPCGCDNPFRIEFFDTEVDSIRIFDIDTQRTIERAECFDAAPSKELVLSSEQRMRLIKRLMEIRDGADTSTERGSRCRQVLERDIERLENGVDFPSLDKYIPHIYEEIPTLLDYIPEDFIIFADEPARIGESTRIRAEERANAVLGMYEAGALPQVGGEYAADWNRMLRRLTVRPFAALSGIAHSVGDIKAKRTFTLNVRSLSGFGGSAEQLRENLEYYKANSYRTIILAGTAERAKNMQTRLEEDGVTCAYQSTPEKLPNRGGVVICGGSVERGFEYPLIRVAVIGDREVFGAEKKKRRKKPLYRGKKGDKISDFTTLNAGDYVVHRNHGIGRYAGIEQLTVEGVRRDYLKLLYKDGDCLYVPTDQLDMVYRYDKSETAAVRLNSLGGADWAKTKQRVKEAAEKMAKELIALYAKRANMPGIAFAPDTEWQRDFEAAFPYEETEDQLRSIAEVKADMEKPHPMDRLLCGDVGYGKTEVAIRAAFKAVMSGYQAAYLVPTTILANQHYNTFRQRMMDYPAEIRMLSRFSTPSEQKDTLKKLATGEVDIVIGTHKLLNKNIKYKKLGLLIVDEEQRFGVGHKERLKELKSDVDVLTLSATPIPRTLHMSLTGIRDMSIINQPPGERRPVETYVMEYDEAVVREAIERELARGGQVYYLYNRVDGIYKAANRIAELVPQARVAVAHGRMNENELENVMMEVVEGETDVLVCTTIIETGLDIANVNTMIIENADRLGLAQLYQLRGRVGRSNRLAYAYLTFRRNKQLTEESEKRLMAMKEFTEFGSGFKIAMRDLEIRGTGNLIGAEQHGHMESVGYEMYCRLLEEAVSEQKGTRAKTAETSVDLPVSAFIPEKYISDHSRRIGAYKRIAAIDSRDSLYDVYDEIEDMYGTVPQSAANLMEIALIKSAASRFGISEINGRDKELLIRFDSECTPDLQYAVELMNKAPKQIYMTNPNNPVLHYRISRPSPSEETKYLREVGEFISKLSGGDANN